MVVLEQQTTPVFNITGQVEVLSACIIQAAQYRYRHTAKFFSIVTILQGLWNQDIDIVPTVRSKVVLLVGFEPVDTC